jgi:hypothetical protein
LSFQLRHVSRLDNRRGPTASDNKPKYGIFRYEFDIGDETYEVEFLEVDADEQERLYKSCPPKYACLRAGEYNGGRYASTLFLIL